MDILIKNLLGQVEMLTDVQVTRKKSSNGNKDISVSVTKTSRNEHAYQLIKSEHYFIYDNEEYVIKKHTERTIGKTIQVDCSAIHRMFDDLNNHRIYEITSGTFQIEPLLEFALSGSGYTYTVDKTDLPLSVVVENFGDDNSSTLLKSILEKFSAEFDISGTNITIAKQIGRITDYQIRYKLNVKNPSKEIDTNSFATYIRGYGKKNEDGTYQAFVEYTSPLAEVYDIKHAPPVRDERYTDNASLLERVKRELNDSINISLKLTYVQLKSLGIQDIQPGDYIWCIIDPFDIDVQIRVVDREDYSSPYKSPIFTLGTISRKASDIMANFNSTKNTVERVVDTSTNIVKQSALSVETNYVVDAIERTFEQVDYADDISVTDPAVFMRKVGIRKGGIYRTIDGTYRLFVITPDGLDLSQVFGILAAEHVSIAADTTFAEGYNPSTKVEVAEYEDFKTKVDALFWMGGI